MIGEPQINLVYLLVFTYLLPLLTSFTYSFVLYSLVISFHIFHILVLLVFVLCFGCLLVGVIFCFSGFRSVPASGLADVVGIGM
ncbi:hypothetical protein BZA77DRAFT_88062 [Pyronema omphalodes]|nr:hypothetical protein BZA77DRAFT_88062 [Pyronema omphalodes]